MNRLYLPTVVGLLIATVVLVPPVAAQKRATLNQQEEDRVRDADDPSERIVVYMDLMDVRLARFDEARRQPVDPKYDQASFLRDLLGEYIALNDELKSWIEDHYERTDDMRAGLRKLIERAPRQLVILRGIQQDEGPHSASYRETLTDAVDQLTDTIDGATRALADQTKKLGELKKQEKDDERISKERAKEESRRTKAEKKERKHQDKKKTVPGDIPEE